MLCTRPEGEICSLGRLVVVQVYLVSREVSVDCRPCNLHKVIPEENYICDRGFVQLLDIFLHVLKTISYILQIYACY